ncbi:MAG: allantoinase PuuE [Pseudomonadota bacterium]
MTANRYPRDLIGYGARPPDPKWPGGAKIAVQFVLNYEEGGENCILHGDASSEAFLSEIVGAEPWPGQRHWNMESIYEYGARAGFWRLHRLFLEMKIPVTVYGVATALARGPEQVAAMQDAGWEIASHGLKWIEYRDFSADEEQLHMAEAIRLHTRVTGERPLGWYTGRCSENTVALAAQEGGFAYVSDSYADDLPYWFYDAGHPQLIIPYTLDANDMRFASAQGFNAGDQFFTYLRDSFDVLYAEGVAGAPKMMSVGLHCRLAGRPGRTQALRRFVEYAAGHADVWFARRIDIAKHWQSTHPPRRPADRPSAMDKVTFLETFGGIFEHSAWVAAEAYNLELGPAHDTPGGLHNAFVRAFRAASFDRRLAVLRSHPDLAVKIDAAAPLTEASEAEQASAGLDILTDEERTRFGELNAAYTEKFAHPFIIAVRDHTKSDVLAAFESRLQNSAETEFQTACRQVERIAELRLAAHFTDTVDPMGFEQDADN